MKTETTTPAPKVGSSDIARPHWITAPRGYAELGSVNDTPETDALRQKLWGEEWSDSYLTMMSHARKLERERDAIAAALQETLALLNHSDTSYPSQEGWWSYERARELEALIPQNRKADSPANPKI
jgi:hypothetical protein